MKRFILCGIFSFMMTILILGSGILIVHINGISAYASEMIRIAQTDGSDIEEKIEDESEYETIVLDAGHGGYDSGGISESGDYEKDITLSITLLLGEYLEEQGFTVIYTRDDDNVNTEDNKTDLQNRVDVAEQNQADYFISLHTNFSDYNDGASGIETYLDMNDDRTLILAENIHNSLNKLNYTTDRGLKDTADYPLYVISKNSVPAILIELGFLSDHNDSEYLLSENGQKQIAKAINECILTTLS